MQCGYKKLNGCCHRKALEDSEKGFCLLHEDWGHKDTEETTKEFYREIEEGITDFEGCILPEVNLSERKIEGFFGISFNDATIKGDINFNGARITGFVKFYGATIEGNAWFSNTTIKRRLIFTRAMISGIVLFERTTVDEGAFFDGATMRGITIFSPEKITELSFTYATFGDMSAQEDACRMAKITQDRVGNRASADYHFYREMEAKRKQKYLHFSLKPILRRIRKLRLEKLIDKHKEFFEKERRIYRGFLELPIQYIFGYGVHPWRVIATWLVAVFALAVVYWIGNGVEAADSILECLYFSIVTAATPGYGGYTPAPGLYQGLASFEAIFGTFMWAAFIATFARKYMR